ncbi:MULTISPECIES: 3-oxo-tetronate 4-phosphate decarboxylase [Ruegeria]|uniref:3-oxo-tetronate 4-phosphate decarboxylase n=1 Tax=Ruegeria faecimaris TaxID=686389 RepID=A0A521EN60_9RHOB|nr:3-oxo-tetronate 4-phosphate decarboxylase [Ruegeria faecimaris]SMO85367.1 Ribulose-5-phosphate 4-epimerase/Fuculose-1-phosphate aldolase [Ruegeria faecimaris]
MNTEAELRQQMSDLCASLFNRGFSVGTAGNVSARLPDGILMTPTNSTLGAIDLDRISKIDLEGNHVAGDRPTKEVFLHQAFYETRQQAGAVVHLHSTWATALSCLEDTNPDDCIPPLTPYVVMRVGTVKLVPYVKPGDPKSGDLIRDLKGAYSAVLLANHGPVVSAKDLFSAVCAAEELEETAKLLVALRGRKTRFLSEADVADLRATYSNM